MDHKISVIDNSYKGKGKLRFSSIGEGNQPFKHQFPFKISVISVYCSFHTVVSDSALLRQSFSKKKCILLKSNAVSYQEIHFQKAEAL